ncbi:MAG: carboxylating nicotinate-nucleotide diphosphorylase, partial [Phycisphaerae bacterium]
MSLEISGDQLEALRDRVRVLAEMARAEDLGRRGDITSPLMEGPRKAGAFRLVARQPGVLAGRPLGAQIVDVFDSAVAVHWDDSVADGCPFEPGQVLAWLEGPKGSILSLERVFLNFMQRLCGVATATRLYVDAVAGTGARIFDTRKTIPAWRLLDKYAVRCGGGCNHRMGLHDAVLIKDNHLAGVAPADLAGAVFAMLNRAASLEPAPALVEVEADTLEQVEQLCKVVGIDVLLLDNFSLDDLRRAVAMRDKLGLKGKVALEASGGVTLEAVRGIAETGVDRISVGAITHSAPAVDLAL